MAEATVAPSRDGQRPLPAAKPSPVLRRVRLVLSHLVLLAAAAVVIFPFISMVTTAFKTPAEAVSFPPRLLPQRWNLSSFQELFAAANILRYFMNSVIVTGVTTLVSLFLNTLTGYAFAKIRFKGRKALFGLVLATYMMPFHVVIIPLYILMHNLGLTNTHAGMILPYLMTTFGIFYMRQAALGIPDELREAAAIDGCSELRFYWQVALPLLKPMLATLAVLTFMDSWSEFLWPMVIASTPEMRTIQVAVAFLRAELSGANFTMAGATLTVLPIVVIFLVAQRWIIAGLTSGALKE